MRIPLWSPVFSGCAWLLPTSRYAAETQPLSFLHLTCSGYLRKMRQIWAKMSSKHPSNCTLRHPKTTNKPFWGLHPPREGWDSSLELKPWDLLFPELSENVGHPGTRGTATQLGGLVGKVCSSPAIVFTDAASSWVSPGAAPPCVGRRTLPPIGVPSRRYFKLKATTVTG